MPTETVYGLAGDAGNPEAVARIYAAKTRPRFNPLISHLRSLNDAMAEGELDARARKLAASFWPGPLTLVVPVASSATTCELSRAGLDTIALRVPEHPVARALLKACGRPLAAPSANKSGRLSPTQASDVAVEFDDGVVSLGAGELVVVPRGVPHRSPETIGNRGRERAFIRSGNRRSPPSGRGIRSRTRHSWHRSESSRRSSGS